MVTRTNPSGGTKVAKGSTVTLNYNVKPGAQALPDVSGHERQSTPRPQLNKAGWKNVITSATPVASLKFKNGEVVSTNPSAGKTIPLNTQIVLNVSGGGVKVPALAGLSQADAHRQAEPGGPDLPDHPGVRTAGNHARHGVEVHRRAAARRCCRPDRSRSTWSRARRRRRARRPRRVEPEPESEPVTE